jgi:hypothetical protein
MEVLQTRKKSSFYKRVAEDNFIARSILLEPIKSILLIRTDIAQEYVNNFTNDFDNGIKNIVEDLKIAIQGDITIYDLFLESTMKKMEKEDFVNIQLNAKRVERELIHFRTLDTPSYKKLGFSTEEYSKIMSGSGAVSEELEEKSMILINEIEKLNEEQSIYFREEEDEIMKHIELLMKLDEIDLKNKEGDSNGRQHSNNSPF